ncbi:MAG: MFS transporter [Sphingomonadales bacterium]|nr:MFS transporter [Sphingomonadales bacterium]
MSQKNGRLDLPLLLAYAAPAIVLSALNMALVVYIPPFYATEVGLSLSAVGIAFFVARAWDALLDPVIGALGDRTHGRFGRRKPWIAVGTPILVAATWALFMPGPGVGMVYLIVTIVAYYAAWTLVQIPYLSWGAELSPDYRERNRIVGLREAATFVGVLLATGLPILIFSGSEPSIGSILMVFLVITVVVLPVSVGAALWRVPSGHTLSTSVAPSLVETISILRRNKPYLLVVSATFLLWLGLHIYNAAVLMVIEFAVGLPKSSFLVLVFVQFMVGTLATPGIVRLANGIGKHRALAMASVLVALSLPLLMAVPSGNQWYAMAVFAVLGVTISPIWILPTALIADTADYAVWKGGGDDVGLYMAIYNFFAKCALAFSVGIALPLLEYFGFDPANQTVQGTITLTLVGLVLPGVPLVMAALLLWRYPITEHRHSVIKRRIQARSKKPVEYSV